MKPASPGPSTSATKARWPRDVWFDAIWDCESLSPPQRAVAYAYARYAGSGDVTWCAEDELKKRTGIPSRNGVWRARKGLIDAGFLKEIEKARQHYSARYQLMFPQAQSSPEGASGDPVDNSDAPSGDIPDAPSGDPDAPSGDPISQTDYSEERTRGHAAPRTPLRQDDPSGRLNETATSTAEVVNAQSNLATQPTTRVHAENVVEFAKPKRKPAECSSCHSWLDPDGTCFVCREVRTS